MVNPTIAIDPAGKVIGASPDNGCKLLGVAAPFVTPTSLSMDVTFSDCRFPGYNRRYSGDLMLNGAQSNAALTLNSVDMRLRVPVVYDIRATMRR